MSKCKEANLGIWTRSSMNVLNRINTPYLFHGLWIFISENLLLAEIFLDDLG